MGQRTCTSCSHGLNSTRPSSETASLLARVPRFLVSGYETSVLCQVHASHSRTRESVPDVAQYRPPGTGSTAVTRPWWACFCASALPHGTGTAGAGAATLLPVRRRLMAWPALIAFAFAFVFVFVRSIHRTKQGCV